MGSGRGYLQDIVANYTRLDISANVARFYHKKFVLGSATAMPLPDNSFDGGWTIRVLEHVPNPEQALSEMRRVMRNNAVIFLNPAWNCSSRAAQGYDVRPYSDLDFKGKLIKATGPAVDSVFFSRAARVPARTLRWSASMFGPTRLHYRSLKANYTEYWQADSDAVNSLDRHDMLLWFRTRGDECLNCARYGGTPLMGDAPLIIRIRK